MALEEKYLLKISKNIPLQINGKSGTALQAYSLLMLEAKPKGL